MAPEKIVNTPNIDYLGELSNFIFTSKYARYREDLQRRETWEECSQRVLDMHLQKYSFLDQKSQERVKWAFDFVKDKRIVPSMRSMQFGGKAIFAQNPRIYNCSVRHIDSLRSFAECFYLLLCGCGVTFGLNNKYLSRLPDLVTEENKNGVAMTYVIEDTIEGWADAVEALLMCYFRNTPYTGRKIVFDFSRIRKKGAPLKTGGGKAPGHKGLKQSLERIKEHLDFIIEKKGVTRLRSIDAYDILMHCSDAVLSGGIRRAATMVVFDRTDTDMMTAKTEFKIDKRGGFILEPNEDKDKNKYLGWVIVDGKKYDVELSTYEYKRLRKDKVIQWHRIYPWRARSNNSVRLMRGTFTKEDLHQIIESTKFWGEPGFLFSDHEDNLVNPCLPGDSVVATDTGLTTIDTLVGKQFRALHQGIPRLSGEKGFWSNGVKETKIITFFSGRKLELTGNHQVQLDSTAWVEADSLKVGDKVVVHNHSVYAHSIDFGSSDFKKGYLVGSFVGDGNYSKGYAQIKFWGEERFLQHQMVYDYLQEVGWGDKRHKRFPKAKSVYTCINSLPLLQFCEAKGIFEKSTESKKLSKDGISGSWSYICGLLRGYFDADGTVLLNKKKGNSVRLTSNILTNLEYVQVALSSLGIYSKIYKNRHVEGFRLMPDGNGGSKEYYCKTTHELVIVKESIKTFYEKVGFGHSEKMKKVKLILDSYVRNFNKTDYVDEVVSIDSGRMVEVFDCTVPETSSFDVNGVMVHNCAEISFIPVTKTGECGVQFCNLSSINGAKVNSEQDFYECVEAATIVGTLQAGYTDFPYLSNTAKQLTEEEALLGVSITGFMDNPDVLLNPTNQYMASKLAVKINKEWSERIYIKQAARITCAKPEGTSSLILKSASGIHPHHARKYLRRVQMNKQDSVYRHFKKTNPHACEESVWSSTKSDDVISFPVEISPKAMTKDDLNALKHLQIIKSTQENWVIPATTEANKKPVHHNISCTVEVGNDEWGTVEDYIFENQQFFTAVSLLPKSGDKAYRQAPLERILPQDEERWNQLISKFKAVDYSTLLEKEDKTELAQTIACGGGACEIDFSKDG